MVFIEEVSCKREIEDVLDNLHHKTKDELLRLFGEEYKERILSELENTKRKYLIKLKDNSTVGTFGVIEYSNDVAGIFLLTKDELKGHKISFLRQAKKVVSIWENEYKVLFDSFFEENKNIKKWILLLGFKPSNFSENGFRIYYKGNVEILAELLK